jgi:hypothetical protein
MATPSRRIVRPQVTVPPPPPDPERQRKAQSLRTQLERERTALVRWQRRLRRAFNAASKHEKSVNRLEKQLNRLGGAA